MERPNDIVYLDTEGHPWRRIKGFGTSQSAGDFERMSHDEAQKLIAAGARKERKTVYP